MNVILKAKYPGRSMKAAIEAFMAPDMPKRPESVKELGSITYALEDGFHVVFLFDVPDKDLPAFFEAQVLRSSYIASRVEGFGIEVHAGPSVQAVIPKVMPIISG